MRVAIFYDYLQTVGGGERVALTLAKGLDADLITTQPDPSLPSRAGFAGVRIVSLGPLLLQPPLKQMHASWKFARARSDGATRSSRSARTSASESGGITEGTRASSIRPYRPRDTASRNSGTSGSP